MTTQVHKSQAALDKARACVRKWKKNNPEKVRAQQKRYKARHPKGGMSEDWKRFLKAHPGWRRITSYNYAIVSAPDHPSANSQGMVYEHRLVAEKKIGRLLAKGEVVHHVDGNRLNNSPDNLEVMTLVGHAKYHRKLRRVL